MEDKATVLKDVRAALDLGRAEAAAGILRERYPFIRLVNAGRQGSFNRDMAVFVRDGFIDRYSGKKLVFPGTLRWISKLLPDQFPFHRNWRTDACHSGYWELFPTIDHITPVARGGTNEESNLVTISMVRNAAKANFTLEELGWKLFPKGDATEWDGLTRWFLDRAQNDATLHSDDYLRKWFAAASSALR